MLGGGPVPGRLVGKVALVSGGARGLGAAVVRLFAANGARVVIADVLEGEGRSVEQEVNDAHGVGTAKYLELDVSRAENWANAMEVAADLFGGLDILISNAGVSGPAGIEAMPMSTWDRIIAVNQTGTLLGMRSAIPLMRLRGGGSIVNVSSIYSIVAADSSPAYQASKAALTQLTKAAALEYAAEAIRANTVHPGLMDTAILEAQGEAKIRARIERTPMHRVAEPIEIAYAVLFLASDEASFITGADFVIDGGYTAC